MEIEEHDTSAADANTWTTPNLLLEVEFTGGLEILFGDTCKHSINVPAKSRSGDAMTAGGLIDYVCENMMTDPRKDMFVLDGHVRPGILVLINDADWELCGKDKYQLQAKDNVLFVSTLHGG